MKWCEGCRRVRNVEDFWNRAGKQSHLKQSRCKECFKKKPRSQNKNVQKIRENVRIGNKKLYTERNPSFMVAKKIGSSRYHGKIHGWVGCAWSTEEVLPYFTTCCQVCGKECGNGICLDHCHKTGKFRGFLCNNCNSTIGWAGEDTDIMNKLILYLEKHR